MTASDKICWALGTLVLQVVLAVAFVWLSWWMVEAWRAGSVVKPALGALGIFGVSLANYALRIGAERIKEVL